MLSWSSSAALVAVTVTVTVTVSFECIQSHHGSRKTCSSFDKQTGPDQPKSIRPYHSINGEKSKITQRDLKARLKANNVHNTTKCVVYFFNISLLTANASQNHDNILNSTSSAQQACIFVHVHNCNKSILIKLNFNNKNDFMYYIFCLKFINAKTIALKRQLAVSIMLKS